ncbi:4-hydroxy-tetrahydrodipicolinate reductase [Congregibacter variabilis]|uniref:4-hydroxy-tetrahydrodipicolinate reductase n=1 Tax=Congregibacter variabilis TaxID=3081200 RepID=A0ABZ0I5N5_9GAMM|nr:4-hydroxy-tetrahydrodipicolinate reductase [Congregibacter sp. IMCC43200]
MSVRIAIAGGNGRMGRTLTELIQSSDELSLAAVTLAQNEVAPVPAPVAAELYTHDIATALADADVLIDFTTPETSVMHAKACAQAGVSWVIGTTGLDASQQSAVEVAAGQIAICQSANFSTGVNLMLRLVELATRASDDDTDLEIIEAHHRHKVDAPSGTALAIGKAMAAARDVSLDDQAVMSREGITGARPPGSIGFATIRGGDIVGDHTALFASEGERLEITHRAGTRLAFARGACRAASWLAGQSAGLYDMQDVLQLRD